MIKNNILMLGLSILVLPVSVQGSVIYGQDYTNIGLSSFVYESPFIEDAEVENTWSPYIALQYKNIFIRDVEIGYQVLNDYDYGAALSLSGDELYRTRGNAAGVDREGLSAKGSFSVYRPSGNYTVSAMQDISGVHDGVQSTLNWFYSLRGSRLNYYPTIYAKWMSPELVEHYFFPEENNAEERIAKAAWRYGVGIGIDYHPHQRWLIQANIANESYSEQIAKSRYVDRSSTWLMSLNVGYYL